MNRTDRSSVMATMLSDRPASLLPERDGRPRNNSGELVMPLLPVRLGERTF